MAANTAANQYIRQVLHHTDPPPPINARFFYTSPVPIDDPLSPLPPPTTAATASIKQEPKAFSEYDNTALDRAWNELRRTILKYNEEHGEKGSREASRVRRPRASSSVVREPRKASGSRDAISRSKAKTISSTLGRDDGLPETEHETEESEHIVTAAELSASPSTTGTPFVRAPSRKKLDPSPLQRFEERPARPKVSQHDTYEWEDPSHLVDHSPAPPPSKQKADTPTTKVAVGVSRLHQVEMPDLQMTPIYWTPVNDVAQVVRGTWFYQDTMLPVETDVANMLEAGYIDLQCWTETWKDELDSAVDVGASGEEKIVHMLWPEKPQAKTVDSRSSSMVVHQSVGEESLVRAAAAHLADGALETTEQQRERAVEAAVDIIDISTGPGGSDNKASGATTWGRAGATRVYASCGVIYANDKEATILKPTLLPSAYYGRRPLANYIRKGRQIGISVIRGFDQAVWNKLHPPKTSTKKTQAEQGAATSGANVARRAVEDPALAKSERPQVSDLVLVIHGIGQKLSQRMESFNFTHAINDFRREIQVECGKADVKMNFRPDMGGMMVLPVNWRHQLSFEEGGYRNEDGSGSGKDEKDDFTLSDITPDTLPSVRGIVSDVMLDIPYYMSQHQPKMIAAVVKEANRVYQLWCQNNPGFAQHGRVHIIAHSLGSVMAIDILSKQPTLVPPHLSDPTSIDLSDPTLDHLLFNTHNLFLAGSPAGFFLLLRRARLRPRIDHPSAQALADPLTNTTAICGERGQYGCIAVDNIYNLMNGYDPVSYQMNATVDASLAGSLRKAFVPSNTPGYWFAAGTSNTTRWFSGRPGPLSNSSTAAVPQLPRLPSQVEMEVHNFTREEVAEKRMVLLNDNGQIDFYLRYGGGMLEIQYLTMLGAHSSYWGLRDFIRLVVMEVGREGGKERSLPGLRAVKKKAVGVK